MSSLLQKEKCAVSKKRQAKATSAQIDLMVDYFVEHPHVATGKFQSLHGRADLTASLENLATELNKMGKDGRTKDVKSWKSTWRDNKTIVSQKVAKIRANRSATGNVGGPPAKLTEREEKILGLMGFDYVEGVEALDAFPEEQPNALQLLTNGDEDVLNIDGSELTVRDSHENNSIDSTDFEMLEGIEITQPLTGESSAILEISETKTLPLATTVSSVPGPSGLQNSTEQKKAQRARKPSRERLGTQMQNAREDFAILAERQVSCMEMFAKSMQQMADNDKERNKILRTFVEAQKARDNTLSNLTSIIRDCVEHLKKE